MESQPADSQSAQPLLLGYAKAASSVLRCDRRANGVTIHLPAPKPAQLARRIMPKAMWLGALGALILADLYFTRSDRMHALWYRVGLIALVCVWLQCCLMFLVPVIRRRHVAPVIELDDEKLSVIDPLSFNLRRHWLRASLLGLEVAPVSTFFGTGTCGRLILDLRWNHTVSILGGTGLAELETIAVELARALGMQNVRGLSAEGWARLVEHEQSNVLTNQELPSAQIAGPSPFGETRIKLNASATARDAVES